MYLSAPTSSTFSSPSRRTERQRSFVSCFLILYVSCWPLSHVGLVTTRLTIDATHIFDGLSVFPTHISHLQLGSTAGELRKWEPELKHEDLFNLALEWIREDRDLRRAKEKAAGRRRGPRARDEVSRRLFIYFVL